MLCLKFAECFWECPSHSRQQHEAQIRGGATDSICGRPASFARGAYTGQFELVTYVVLARQLVKLVKKHGGWKWMSRFVHTARQSYLT